MPLTIPELDKKWKTESEKYRTHEVGSGTQKFVKDVLESNNLFSLSQGKLSTSLAKRKNEFTEESRAKAGRKADVLIYIDQDIIIPVEIEKYGHIEAGEEQLKNYQTDFDKQYGILTDGYEWRFYNNNLFRAFFLPDMLKDSQLFLSFWGSYIQPLNYYINFFEPLGQQKIFDKTDHLSVEGSRILFFEDITKLIRSLENKLNIAGYLDSIEEKNRKKKAVELTYAYVIQFILYKTLVDNEFDDFKQEFDQRVNGIKESIKAEHFKEALSTIQGISDEISHNIYRPFAKEQEVISETLRQILAAPKNTLPEVAPWLDIFVFIKKYNFANVKNDIFGYIYENYLKDLYEDEKKGQYFTDPAIVDFMLDQIDYVPDNLSNLYTKDRQSISIVDPSCGSGTFLYSATHRIVQAFSGDTEGASKLIEDIVNKNVFGLDIEEFPLYLAEMNILMRLMTYIINEKYNNPIDKKIKVFWTKDSLAEFLDTAIRNTFADQSAAFQKSGGHSGQVELFSKKLDLGYKSYVRDESDIEEMKKSLENLEKIPRSRFDFVVGNPPYMHYNQASAQGILIFNLIKSKQVKLNDIYGVNLHSVPKHTKKYRPNPNIYAFFIALGLSLLKDNGTLCYIIPQTILTAGDLDVIRYHLAKFTTIEKLVIFSGKMFVGRGLQQNKPIPTSSLVLVVRREQPRLTAQTEVIHYDSPDDDIATCLENIRRAKKTKRYKIQQSELLVNISNWNFIKADPGFLNLWKTYKKNSEDLSVYYNHQEATIKFNSKFYFDGGYSFDEKKLLDKEANETYIIPKLDSKFYGVEGVKGYWPKVRHGNDPYVIRLRQANQAYHLLDSQYKVVWSTKNPHRFHYTDKEIIWANIRLSGIGSSNKMELLYLFSILNSPVSSYLIKMLLGIENEKDLLLPITSIKELIRVPIINEKNMEAKKKIIELANQLLELENLKLSDFVEFDNIQTQKFDSVVIKGSALVLTRNGNTHTAVIKDQVPLVRFIIENSNFGDEISLFDLKNLPVVNTDRQKSIKKEIDQLVYKLYNLTPEEIKIVES